jgi:hypothetical protein
VVVSFRTQPRFKNLLHYHRAGRLRLGEQKEFVFVATAESSAVPGIETHGPLQIPCETPTRHYQYVETLTEQSQGHSTAARQ